MTNGEKSGITEHYTTENLLGRIKAALVASGKDPETLKPEDLKGVDEFHTGGIQATDDLLAQLTITDITEVLDIGCGIGGTARHIVANTGATVTGIDLTPNYIETAELLSEMVGMNDRTNFQIGSASEIPLSDSGFDLVTMFHVGMNIPDKSALFSEVARVLKPDGTFALFDIMETSEGSLTFPFPWAEKADWSFVGTPDVYKAAAAQAGFTHLSERDRRDFTIEFFENVFAALEKNGAPPPVGIHLLMKDTAAVKLQNYFNEVKAGRLAPFEMIFRL